MIVSAYAHYIDSWPMNGAINLAAILDDREENLKPEQMNVTHVSVMESLGDPSNPLYAEPHSMAEHFDALLAGTHAIGELPSRMHCKDGDATVQVYKDETTQVCQKILRCLDMKVMDSQGFMQPCGDIRTSIVPRDFRQLPADMRELIDQYFHREELERKADMEEEESMSTDTEVTETICRLNLWCPEATEALQVAVHKALELATAVRPAEEEYYYDSDDSVLDIDEQFPELAERVVQWQATQRGDASTPPWHPPDFSQQERATFSRLPDLREMLDQAKAARAAGQVPVQSVAPMQLPFTSVWDLEY